MGPRRWSWRDAEAYLTVGLALTAGFLELVGIVDPEVVYAATLSLLAFIAFELLEGRRQARRSEAVIERLNRAIEGAPRCSMDEVISVAEPGADRGMDRARDIRLAGVTLNRTIRSQLPALERCLLNEGSVRVVLIDPASAAVGEAARRNGLPGDVGLFEHRLHPTVDLLGYLAALPSAVDRLEVRFADFVPSFGVVMVDPDTAHGMLMVDVYSHRPGGHEPTLTLTAERDPGWYRHFRAEFDQIWANSRPQGCPFRSTEGNCLP